MKRRNTIFKQKKHFMSHFERVMIKIAETNEFFKESFKKEKNGVTRDACFNSLASNVISFLSQSL